jgi:hypothetical protein
MIHELLAPLPVNATVDEIACVERSIDQVEDVITDLSRVENRALCCCSFQSTKIAFLATAFGIETSFVQDDCMSCTIGRILSDQW